MSNVVCKVSLYYWHFGQIILCLGAVLCIGRCLAGTRTSTHWKPIAGGRWHTQNIQINKVIGENEKHILYFMENTKQTFWPTQYYTMVYLQNCFSWFISWQQHWILLQFYWKPSKLQKDLTPHSFVTTICFFVIDSIVWNCLSGTLRILHHRAVYPGNIEDG